MRPCRTRARPTATAPVHGEAAAAEPGNAAGAARGFPSAAGRTHG